MTKRHSLTSSSSVLDSGELQWSSRPVVFHQNTGSNVVLTEINTVATRANAENECNGGIVFTSQPVPTGQMLKVTVTRIAEDWKGGLNIGFSQAPLNCSNIPSSLDEYTFLVCTIMRQNIWSSDDFLDRLDFNIGRLAVGQSFGMLFTKERDLHWFLDDKWRGTVHVNDYSPDKPVWGVIDVYGLCVQVRAEICSVSSYPPSSERRLIEMGIVGQPTAQDSLRQEIQTKDRQIVQLQQDLDRQREAAAVESQRLQQQLSQANHLRQQSDAENQQLVATLRQQIDVLQRRVTSLSTANRSQNPQEVEFWQVSPEEVTIREDQVLGGGAWGYVAKGTFRGTAVAVKRVYRSILQMSTVERIRREIRTMAQIRHPNLVLFIAAVLNEQTGPMIVTELLDTSLRSAYQDHCIGANKRKIFGDVSSALVYLHGQREPIIHRDVSSANVLLIAQPRDTWLAKLSDFGSANLARYATTPGEGAILYTAPEAYPQPPTSPRPPPPQTTKIDVYSFGVVACEVVTSTFPESDKFRALLEDVSRVWPQVHPLITSCVSYSPEDRPTMDTVLSRVRQLDWEP